MEAGVPLPELEALWARAGGAAARFAEVLRFLEKTTLEGEVVTLSYEANDGQRGAIYLDGDGRDRVHLL